MEKQKISLRLLPAVVYISIAWLILAPLFRPGFIFFLDMIPRTIWKFPDTLDNSLLFFTVMHILNFVIPSELLQKLLLAGIIFLIGLGAHKLYMSVMDSRSENIGLAAYVAGILYIFNPFVYSRFITGQYAVLFGYALLPWFARSLLALLRKPSWRQALRTGIWVAVIGIVSVHTLGLVLILAFTAAVVCAWQRRRDREYLKRVLLGCGLAGLTFLVLSSYWLAPSLAGQSATAEAVRGFGGDDIYAFQTLGDGLPGKLGHVVRLEGFWAESTLFFRSAHDTGLFWWLGFIVLIGLTVLGAVRLWRARKRDVVIIFGAAALIAGLLAAGAGVSWLSAIVPFFGGYREPHKFTGLVGVAYALFAGAGAYTVLHWARKRGKKLAPLAVIAVLAFPLLLSPHLLLGAGGQLHAAQYPAGWYAVNERLKDDDDEFRVLFLPWHLYMHFGFAGTIMANPAEKFFDKPVIVNNDPEFRGSSPSTNNQDKDKLGKRILPQANDRQDLGAKIAPLNIKYVIYTSDSDAANYIYVTKQPDLKLVYDDPQIKLYKNLAWEAR